MTRTVLSLSLLLPLGLFACKSDDSYTSEEIVLCGDCGVEKGTEGCCDAEAMRCDSCGKIKGSAGCCK